MPGEHKAGSRPKNRSGKPGKLIEYNDTKTLFTTPQEQATEDYVSGRFG